LVGVIKAPCKANPVIKFKATASDTNDKYTGLLE
jgi:hypothetical protein